MTFLAAQPHTQSREMWGCKGRERESKGPQDPEEDGLRHLIQIFLNLQLPTKLPVQPQEQKSVVREGYELTSLDS